MLWLIFGIIAVTIGTIRGIVNENRRLKKSHNPLDAPDRVMHLSMCVGFFVIGALALASAASCYHFGASNGDLAVVVWSGLFALVGGSGCVLAGRNFGTLLRTMC